MNKLGKEVELKMGKLGPRGCLPSAVADRLRMGSGKNASSLRANKTLAPHLALCDIVVRARARETGPTELGG